MSSLRNIKRNVQAVRQNDGILLTDQTQLVGRTSAPSDSNLADGRIYYNSTATKAYIRAGSTWVDLTGSGSGGVTTWDALYALDQNLNISSTYGTLTFAVTGNTAGLTLAKTGTGAGGVLVISNAGTGDDITGPDFSFNGDGTLTVVELGTGATINATDGDLELSVSGSTTTIQGDLLCDEAAEFTTDVVLTDGSITLTDADEAASLVVTNDTAAAVNVVEIQADAIAAGGVLLHLDSLAAGMSTGLFFECYDGEASAFTIGLYGATVIAGNAATDVLTITAGDISIADGSITLVDADDATSFSVTNDSAAAASLVEFAGSGTFTGTTTTSFMTITPSGMVVGTGVYLPLAAMTSGTGMQIVANAITSGQALEITSSATTLATTGRLLSVVGSGATGTSAVIAEFSSAATDETTVLRVTATAALALGVILDVSGEALTTGKAIDISNLDAITTGKALHIDATGVTQTDGILAHIDSASTALTATGRLLLVDHTGNASVSGVLSEFASAATDETLIVKITASGALALGAMLHFEGASVTTGDIIIAEALDALTTGIGIHLESGATALTGAGRLAYFNHTGATTTSGTLVEIASAGTDETVMFQLTASAALAAGVVQKITAASMTTGTAIEIDGLDALTDGIGLDIESASTTMTATGRLLSVDHSGNASVSGVLAEFKSAAADETVMVQVQATAALAAGAMLKFIGASVTTGSVITAEALDALTTGIGVHIESGATAITGAGRLAYFNHTGATTTNGTLVEVASAATDETIMMSLTATGALALGTALLITADSCTTGKGIDMTMDALTTGTAINVVSDSADATARILVNIHNDNTAAVGTVPLTIVQDALTSTHFKKVQTLAGISVWISDGTTPNAALTATTGDLCLAGDSGKPYYCTNGGGALWTALV